MKRQLIPLLLAAAVFFQSRAETTPPPPASANYVLGISPYLDRPVKDDLYRRIIGFLLEQLPMNASLAVYDAYNAKTVSQITIPNARAFQSAKTRANQLKDEIRKIREFLAASPERPQVAGFSFDQAVRLPQFLDFIAQNVAGGNPLTIVVVGSPLYMDEKEPGFSMMNGYFPSDGHLLASRDKSVFGLKDRGGALAGTTLHLAYFGDPWVSAIHQEKVTRFWSLYLQAQGGRVGTFCGDLATVFNAIRPGASVEQAERIAALDTMNPKVEMLRITRDIGSADWITRDNLPATPPPPPSRTSGPMKIGIRWKGQIDLDLYASPSAEGETLFFEHTRSPEGYYFKDHRSSPDREYEFIEFESPVDVWEVEARINFYEGRTPRGASGEIRIEFDGRIYGRSFSLAANRGNQGRSGRSQADYWSDIDVPGILGLRDERQAVRAR